MKPALVPAAAAAVLQPSLMLRLLLRMVVRTAQPFAWFVWLFVHLFSILGTKNKLFIFVNWVWNYVTYDQSLRLVIKPWAKPAAATTKEQVIKT